MKVLFRKGEQPDEWVLEMTEVSEQLCQRVHGKIATWVGDFYRKARERGMKGFPSIGEYSVDHAWADLVDGPMFVNLRESRIHVFVRSEGDDDHPFRNRHLWLNVLPRVQHLFAEGVAIH